jgi:hypothetical protein
VSEMMFTKHFERPYFIREHKNEWRYEYIKYLIQVKRGFRTTSEVLNYKSEAGTGEDI